MEILIILQKRLNVMANVLQKPLVKLFNEFYMETKEGAELAGSVQGTGDVKYHIGTSADRVLPSGKKVLFFYFFIYYQFSTKFKFFNLLKLFIYFIYLK